MRKTLRFFLPASLVLSLGHAQAGVSDSAVFEVPGIVIVWAADTSGGAPVVGDFIVANSTTNSDLITDDLHTVVTGQLVSTADIGLGFGGIPFVIEDTANGDIVTDVNGDGLLNTDDSFSGFDLTLTTDTEVGVVSTQTSFYVASNTPFSITVEADDTGNTAIEDAILAFVDLDMQVTQNGTDDGFSFGSAAQFPHSAGASGGVTEPASLADVVGPANAQTIFTGDQATALTPGTIAEQSVRFDQTYTVGFTGYDLFLGTFDFDIDVIYTVFVP